MPEKEIIDHESTDNIVCPYCGYEYWGSSEYPDSDDYFECVNCKKHFFMEIDVSVTYTTLKLQTDCGHEDLRVYEGYKRCDECRLFEKIES